MGAESCEKSESFVATFGRKLWSITLFLHARYGNPYLHDRRANKSCTTRKRLQNHTFRNPSLKLFKLCVLFSYSLLCALLGGRWWRSSVFRSMILFWISSAIQQQTPQANTTATGTVAAGQQRPRAPTTPAGNTPSR